MSLTLGLDISQPTKTDKRRPQKTHPEFKALRDEPPACSSWSVSTKGTGKLAGCIGGRAQNAAGVKDEIRS